MAAPPKSHIERERRRAGVLERLLRSERRRLLNQARFHSRSPEDAEDALSDACVAFMGAYEGDEDVHALRWMMLVVKRCAWAIAANRKVREARRPEEVPEDHDATLVDHGDGPQELAERGEELAAMTGLIEALKPDERAALILLGLGASYREIAELRGWTLTKVNRCVAEGRARVRELGAGGKR